MFHIKICGITSVDDAQAVADAGADAIGLNFYRESPRCVDETRAAKIAKSVPKDVSCVGVFVNHDPREVLRLVEVVGLDWIQLHGDESPASLSAFAGHKIIRAFRCRDEPQTGVLDYLAACPHRPEAVLIDAYHAKSYGGTGRVVDWESVRALSTQLTDVPVILAGGLTDANVAAAIATARPDAVDTASGVEASPGVKDHAVTQKFVAEARQAFAGLDAL